MKPYLVLVAEDNPDHALLTAEAIESTHGPDVELRVFQNGAEALAYLSDETNRLPGLILLDIQMPELDGFATLEGIKSDPRLRVIPVVMLTSSDDERDIARSYGLGTNSYVTKPLGADELAERIAQIPSYWFGINTPPADGGDGG